MKKKSNDNYKKMLKIPEILSIITVINILLFILDKKNNYESIILIVGLNVIIFLYLMIIIIKNIINYNGDNYKKVFIMSFLPLLITIVGGFFLKNDLSGTGMDYGYYDLSNGILISVLFNMHILFLSLIFQAGVLYKRKDCKLKK